MSKKYRKFCLNCKRTFESTNSKSCPHCGRDNWVWEQEGTGEIGSVLQAALARGRKEAATIDAMMRRFGR